MQLGTKIKDMRLQLNLTQEELADRCELTKGYISQLENDLTSPSIATLGDILDALGSSFSEFFRGEKNEKVVFSENDYIEKESDGLVQNWLVPNAQKNLMEPLSVELAPHASTRRGCAARRGRIRLRAGGKDHALPRQEKICLPCGRKFLLFRGQNAQNIQRFGREGEFPVDFLPSQFLRRIRRGETGASRSHTEINFGRDKRNGRTEKRRKDHSARQRDEGV